MRQQWNISLLNCGVQQKGEFIRQRAVTSYVTGLSRSSKALPKTNLATKSRSWSLFAGLIHYRFLNLCESITSEMYSQQINEMHQKLQCLQPALANRMDPILFCNNTQLHSAQPTLQKLNELGNEVLPHLSYSLDLLPSDCHFFKHPDFFGRENSSTNSRMEEMLFKSSLNPEAQNSFATGLKPSNWQKCVNGNGSYFD